MYLAISNIRDTNSYKKHSLQFTQNRSVIIAEFSSPEVIPKTIEEKEKVLENVDLQDIWDARVFLFHEPTFRSNSKSV